MPLLTISAAAEAAGVNRRTLQRAIADGRLSVTRDAQGKRGVDPAELFRVFAAPATVAPVAATATATMSQPAAPENATVAPAPQSAAAPETASAPPAAAPATTAEAVALEVLRAQLAAATEREAWLRSLLDAERASRHNLEQRLLPAPPRAFAERLADTIAALRRAWRGER